MSIVRKFWKVFAKVLGPGESFALFYPVFAKVLESFRKVFRLGLNETVEVFRQVPVVLETLARDRRVLLVP